ncbi:MAG: restriction endonuclease subunit S, partial [Terrimicrobiaceae bacterium]
MSFPRYPKYKPSGVEWLGDVPEHWEVRKIRWLFEIKKRIAGDLGFDVFSITQQGIRVKDLESNDGQISMDYSKYQLVEVGDFAMNHMDLLTGGVDIAAARGVTSPDYRVVTIRDQSTSHDRFFLYLFQMCYRNKIFYGFGQGSSQLGRWRLPTEQFIDFVFPLPSLAEQTAIAEFIDRETAKIDVLVAEQQRLMELLKEKRQAVISHAVTKGLNPRVPMKPSGIEWLGDVPAHWAVRRVKSVSTFITSGPRGWSERVGEVGPIFVQSGDLNDSLQVEFSTAKRVQVEQDAEAVRTRLCDGDIVVCITGAKTGNVAVCAAVPEPAYVNQHLCLIRPSREILSVFLGVGLKSRVGQTYFELSQYGLKHGLSLDDVKEAPVLLPPMAEQKEIAEFVGIESAKFDALTAEAQRAIDLLQERRTALISAAVTGQIDV